jgi:Family of unknown function (DUF6524)
MERLTLKGFLLRLLAALLLVALTWNPTGYDYLHWVVRNGTGITPGEVLAGLALFGAWVFVVHATWRSLGPFGVGLGAAIAGALVWLLVSSGWIDLSHPGVAGWLAITVAGLLLATGLSFSLIQRRVTGQIDVEDSHSR